MPFKTVETKVSLLTGQLAMFEETLKVCDWIWNEGLSALFEIHQFSYYKWLEKKAKQLNFDITDIQIREVQFAKRSAWNAASCKIAYIKDGKYNPVHPRLLANIEPRLKSDTFNSLSKYLTISKINNLLEIRHLPPLPTFFHSDWLGGVLERLIESWKAYKSTDRQDSHKPKFKCEKNRNLSKSIYTNQSSSISFVDSVMFPNKRFGGIDLVGKSLIKFFAKNPEASIRSLTLKKEPSGFYICLCVKLPDVAIIPPANKPHIGIDPGVVRTWTDDHGNYADNPKFLAKSKNKLLKLQQQLERQLAHSDNKDRDQKECANIQKTRHKISREHERIRRQRKRFQQKQVHDLVARSSSITCEDFKPKNTIRKPKPKLNEDGTYAKNKRKAKAGLNRSLSDSAIGQFKQLLEYKCESSGVSFTLVPAHNTSNTCSSCGYSDPKNRLKQDLFECVKCGMKMNADHNAAINIKRKNQASIQT